LTELACQTRSDKLIILNVEDGNYLGKILRKLGFRQTVNQWEMILEMG